MAKRETKGDAVVRATAGSTHDRDQTRQHAGWIIGSNSGESFATGREKPNVRGVGRTRLERDR